MKTALALECPLFTPFGDRIPPKPTTRPSHPREALQWKGEVEHLRRFIQNLKDSVYLYRDPLAAQFQLEYRLPDFRMEGVAPDVFRWMMCKIQFKDQSRYCFYPRIWQIHSCRILLVQETNTPPVPPQVPPTVVTFYSETTHTPAEHIRTVHVARFAS